MTQTPEKDKIYWSNGEICRFDGIDFVPLTPEEACAVGVDAGLRKALEIAESYASEEVEKEARTRFVHGQVVGARRIRDEIQALINKQSDGGVSNG